MVSLLSILPKYIQRLIDTSVHSYALLQVHDEYRNTYGITDINSLTLRIYRKSIVGMIIYNWRRMDLIPYSSDDCVFNINGAPVCSLPKRYTYSNTALKMIR